MARNTGPIFESDLVRDFTLSIAAHPFSDVTEARALRFLGVCGIALVWALGLAGQEGPTFWDIELPGTRNVTLAAIGLVVYTFALWALSAWRDRVRFDTTVGRARDRLILRALQKVVPVDTAIARAQRAALELEPQFAQLEERSAKVEATYAEPMRTARERYTAAQEKYQKAVARGAAATTAEEKEAAQREINDAAGEYEDALAEETDLRSQRNAELENISAARERYWQRIRVPPEVLQQHAAQVADRSHLDLRAALAPASRREGMHFLLEIGIPVGLFVATLVALVARFRALTELARSLTG